MGLALTIALKDLRLRVRDRSAFILGVIAPLGLALIFNAVLGDLGDGAFTLRYGIVDQDGGSVSTQFVGLLSDLDRQGILELSYPADETEAVDLVDRSELSAVFVIPAGFSDAVSSGTAIDVRVLGDVDQPTSASIAKAIGESFSSEVRTVQLSIATALTGMAGPAGTSVDDLAARATRVPPPITVGNVAAATRELDLTTFFVAGMAIFFLFFTVQFGVLSLLEEKKFGTMARLLGAPMSRVSIIAGKGIVSFVLGAVSMTVLVVASTLLMGAQWGDPFAVAVLTISAILAAVGLMALIAAFAKTAEAAGTIQSIFAVGLGMLGGIFFPVALGEGLLAKLSYISPHRWFMVGLADLAGGGGVAVVLPSVVALVGFGVVSSAIAYSRLRKGLAA